MKRVLASLALTLVLASCSQNNDSAKHAKFYRSGAAKPVVAIVPVVNHSESDFEWGLSKEITSSICERLLNDGSLFISTDGFHNAVIEKFNSQDLIATHKSAIEQVAVNNEFLVLMEMLEHKEVPYKRQHIKPLYPVDGEVTSVLMMKMRIVVYDLRGIEPKVVLQEILHSNHMMPKNGMNIDYDKIPWGSSGYTATPVGAAHARLARDIAHQLENYVSIAKSH